MKCTKSLARLDGPKLHMKKLTKKWSRSCLFDPVSKAQTMMLQETSVRSENTLEKLKIVN